MKVGYARVSTPSQTESLRAQSLELEAAGCERVFTDIASGARSDRPGLAAAVAYLRAVDMLTVTRLDRLGRTTVDTLKTVRDLDARGIRVTAREGEPFTAYEVSPFRQVSPCSPWRGGTRGGRPRAARSRELPCLTRA